MAFAFAVLAAGEAHAGFSEMRRHYLGNRPNSFDRAAAKLKSDSPLQPLADHWRAVIQLRRQRPKMLEDIASTSPSPYLRARAAKRLADYYAGKKRWQDFARFADVSPCAAVLHQMHSPKNSSGGGDVGDALKKLWAKEEKFNDALCLAAYKQGRLLGMIDGGAVWKKLRTLAGDRRLGPVKRFIRHFRPGVSYGTVRKVILGARRHILGKHSLATRANREMVMIAAMSASSRHPSTAIRRWRAFSRYFSPEENDHVWTHIAERAARAHRDDALDLYRRAAATAETDESARAWRLRAALRAGDDAEVIRTAQSMPPEQYALSAWRYWHASALARAGDKALSQKIMRALAEEEDDYYGLLAREAEGMPLFSAEGSAAVTGWESKKAEGDFAMGLAVWSGGDEKLARRIWRHAISHAKEGGDSSALLAGARAAQEAKWHLASINAANAAGTEAAHALRYPTPYRELIEKYSGRFGLEPAFVYALVRRESRFMPKAISSARARGLMQVMPATARKVARKHRYSRYRLSRLTLPATNVIIGATYLRDLAERFDGRPVEVASAYNAGPGRAVRWRRNNREADLLARVENIPFLETRLYVKAVLAARAHYARRMGESELSMLEFVRRKMRTPS